MLVFALLQADVLFGDDHCGSEQSTESGDAVVKFVEAKRKAYRIPGFSLAIIQSGKIVPATGFGLASVEPAEANRPVRCLTALGSLHCWWKDATGVLGSSRPTPTARAGSSTCEFLPYPA